MYNAIAIIPARYASTPPPYRANRSPTSTAKHSYKGSMNNTKSKKHPTNNHSNRRPPHIEQECQRIGAEYILTDPALPSGTDRIAQAYQKLGDTADFVLNVQGDEPIVPPQLLDDLISAAYNNNSHITTPITPIRTTEELLNPTIVTVAMNQHQQALYFSRSPIPHLQGKPIDQWLDNQTYWKHIGLYCYKAEMLRTFAELPPSPLEKSESLEQLRLLENGAIIHCVKTNATLIAVDTPDDAQKVRDYLNHHNLE
jgi:3-deoxy-manno-octulosonate cytidylyltransferase (CMP-KDO synthetase)